MKHTLITIILFLTLSSTTFAGGNILLRTYEDYNKIIENIEYEEREKLYSYMERYSTIQSKYEAEILKKKYKIGKYSEELTKKYEKTQKEILQKIEHISKEFAQEIQKTSQYLGIETAEILLDELNIDQSIYLDEKKDDIDSFYKKDIKIQSSDEVIFGKNITEIYIVQKMFQTEKTDLYDAKRDLGYERIEGIYEEEDFKKLNSQKMMLVDFKKEGFSIDFLKEFSKLQLNNQIEVALFIEYNGLYIGINNYNQSFDLQNSSKEKLFFLEENYLGKDNGLPFGLDFAPDFPGNKNPLLEKKISRILENLEKKLEGEAWNDFLLKLDKKLGEYKSSFEEKGLKIAEKINPKSNIDIIFSEFKKFKHKQEVLDILSKQVVFKLKESAYDSALEEFINIDEIEIE